MRRNLRVWTWPNALSLFRLPLAAVFPLTQSTPVRCTVLVLAAAADFLDGQIARRYHQSSRVGEVLDPIADKVFVGTALVTFLVEGSLSLGQTALLLARDVYCALGWLVLMSRENPPRVKARPPGKLVTVLQLLTMVLVLLAPGVVRVVVPVVAVAGAWAIVDYTWVAVRSLRQQGQAP
ncbi:MAG: CDP-alcohol phosphatidyltransferase family protein [Gemmatimonadota bacterium]